MKMFCDSNGNAPTISRESAFRNYFKKNDTPKVIIDAFNEAWSDFTKCSYSYVATMIRNPNGIRRI